jgi:predicted ATPase
LSTPLERRLHIALGIALILTMGPVERTRAVVAKAREKAESVDDVEAQLRTLWAQWSMENIIGEYRSSQSTAQRFSEVARSTGDQSLILVAQVFVGAALLFEGKSHEAIGCFVQVLEHYVPPPNRRHTILFHYDQRVLARARLARVLLLQGRVAQAKEQARISLEEAQAGDAGFTLCWVLHHAVCPIAIMTGDLAVADRGTATMSDPATKFDAALWKILANCWQGKSLVERREFARGSALLRNALDACDQTGWRICNAEFLGALAEGLAGIGHIDTARITIDKALARAKDSGELYFIPELLRIKGELLLDPAENDPLSAAEGCFFGAIAMAREQDAPIWELRAALGLARMRARQDRREEGKRILASVYDRFTEGFETADLLAASDLLEELT